ncbi:hypothetical protein PC113_g17138 [Phytophthora cactorum]|uniref:Thioredoxin-like fold n=1 Tax=Phytophthora cactorum TaxID=29920 RepID=A0A8T0YJX8_9STRA|nr:hypothetical protein PC113_g17138 [Phytophthora cactorum]
MGLSMGVGSVAILLSIGSVWLAALVTAKETQKILRNKDAEREARHREAKASQLSSSDLGSSFNQPKDNYKQNFRLVLLYYPHDTSPACEQMLISTYDVLRPSQPPTVYMAIPRDVCLGYDFSRREEQLRVVRVPDQVWDQDLGGP